MRVLQLLPELKLGGVERGTVDLSEYLVSMGHESAVVSAGGGWSKNYQIMARPISLFPLLRKTFRP